MTSTPSVDDILLSKLARICEEDGDLRSAREFASVSVRPDFPLCRKCRAPLIVGKTSRARVRKPSILTLSCGLCLERNAGVLKLKKEKKHKSRKTTSASAPSNTIPTTTTTPGSKQHSSALTTKTPMAATGKTPATAKSSSTAPSTTKKLKLDEIPPKTPTLLELAERKAKEEKKKQKAEAKSAPSSLANIAKLLSN